MAAKDTRIVIDSWDGEDPSGLIDAIQRILIPVVDKEIHLCVPHGHPQAIRGDGKDGKFRVLIWSAPSGVNEVDVPARMFGISVDCRDSAYDSSEEGIPIMDGRYCVATLYNDDHLYIHHDICHYGRTTEVEIFSTILQKAAEILQDKEVKDWNAVYQDVFVDIVSNEVEEKKEKKGSKKKSDKKSKEGDKDKDKGKTLRGIQQRLAKKLRDLGALESKLNRGGGGDSAQERMKAELEQICCIEGVKKVEVRGSHVDIFTSMLYCPHDHTHDIYAIGEFKITFDLEGESDCDCGCCECEDNDDNFVRWHNLSSGKYRPGCEFPHDMGESVCAGTAEGVIPGLLKKGEIAAAAVYAIKFIQSANVRDSAGARLTMWPIYKTAEQVAASKTRIALTAPVKSSPTLKITPEALKRLVAAGDTDRVRKIESDIETCREEIGSIQKQLVRELRRDHKTTKEQARVEFEKTKAIKGVDQIRVHGSSIYIHTDMLYCTSRMGSVHKIGKFKIVLSFDTASAPPIVWQNITVSEGKQAPYVEGDGGAYIEGIATMFPALIGSGDIALAVTQAIRFIESDIGDGSEVAKWPVREVKKVKTSKTSKKKKKEGKK